jgi:hypothetical protein
VGGVRARDADGLHHSLHGMAPAVVRVDFFMAHMALGVAGGLELGAARRTHHMPIDALQACISIYVVINSSSTCE